MGHTMLHTRTAPLTAAALLLTSCATPAPSIDHARPPGQPRADPLALIAGDDADAPLDLEVLAQSYVELDGRWPAELAFIAGEPDEDPYADSDRRLYVYAFDASGAAKQTHERATWARSLVATPVDPGSGRHALVLHGGSPGAPGALDEILELHDGALRDATFVTTPTHAVLALDADGQGAHELLAFNDDARKGHAHVYVLARDPDGFWRARAPRTPPTRWIPTAWDAYTDQGLGGDARVVLPKLLTAAHDAGVTLTLSPARRAQARDVLMSSPDPLERFALAYALLDTEGAAPADTLRDALAPEHGLELALLWYAFALREDDTQARRDAFVALLESGIEPAWFEDARDRRHAHRAADMVARSFAAAGDGRLLTYLRARPNTRRALATLFAPAWRSDAMLEDMAARPPSAPEARAVLRAFGAHGDADRWARDLTAAFATPARRAQLDAWLDMNDASLLNSACMAYQYTQAADSPCTEDRVLAVMEAAASGDVTGAQHLLPFLPASPTTPAARARYDALAAHPRLDAFGRHELGMRLLGPDEVAARVGLIAAMDPYLWCDAVDASLRPQVDAMTSPQRGAFFTRALDALGADDPYLEMTFLACFGGVEEATQAHTPAQKDAVLTRALDTRSDLDLFALLRWDIDAFATLTSVYLDTCVGQLEQGAHVPSFEQCGYMLAVAPYVYDEARSKRLDDLARSIEQGDPEDGYACAAWSTAATLSLLHWDAHTQDLITRTRPDPFDAACNSASAPFTREAIEAISLTLSTPWPRRRALLEWARAHPNVRVRTAAHDE
jgi:hypothetical protein